MIGCWFSPAPALAQTLPTDTLMELVASNAAKAATPAAQVVEKIEQKEAQDITQTTPQVKSRLARFLDENPADPPAWHNFIQHALRRAVNQGVPANILVLLLLFPVIASFIAISRHFIGLEGFGIYVPAVLSVALLSTGIISGILLFLLIIVTANLSREVIKRFRLQYLPRTALLLWAVSLMVFALLLFSPLLLNLGIDLVALSIFPILVLILLSENFIDAQLSTTQSRALELTLETIVLAVFSTLFVRTEFVQEFVILHPEITIMSVLAADLMVGRYTGLRVSEYLRFKNILDPEE